jgi:hypothetical protein
MGIVEVIYKPRNIENNICFIYPDCDNIELIIKNKDKENVYYQYYNYDEFSDFHNYVVNKLKVFKNKKYTIEYCVKVKIYDNNSTIHEYFIYR